MLEFPHKSVTVYVRVITIGQDPVGTSLLVTASEAEQASVTVRPKDCKPATLVAAAGAAEMLHPLTVTFANGPVIEGGVTSCTIITWLAVDVFKHPSVAVQIRVIVRVPGHDPCTMISGIDVNEELLKGP